MKTKQFYMRWREDFDDQEGWFETEKELIAEVLRIQMLADDGDGEACVMTIVKGKDVTDEFLEGKMR